MDETGGELSVSALPKIKTLKEFMERKNLIKSKISCDPEINDQLMQLKPKVICKSETHSYSKHLAEKLRELTNFEVFNKITTEIPKLKSENNVIDLDFEPKILRFKRVGLTNGFNSNHRGKKSNDKPECSYTKLKKDLKRLVTIRREMEIKRKFEKNKDVTKDEENPEKLNEEDLEEKMDEDEEESEEEQEQDECYDEIDEEQDDGEEENNENVDENYEIEVDAKETEIEEKNEKSEDDHQNQNVDDEIENENCLSLDMSDQKKSQNLNLKTNETFISQIPNTSTISEDDENYLANLCSGKFTNTQNNYPDLQSSDDEDDDDPPCDIRQKKMKKRPVISDDSDDDTGESDNEDNNNSPENEMDSESIEKPGNESDVYVDYDSEENEIEVKVTKDDWQKKAAEFFENEAELSESEWGSDDEDEKDLDKYDIELGDEDEFDQDKLRSDLEKIHMRKILDEDMRNLKKIQEMFFDDEENDGIGRERQFKWKNIGNNNLIQNNCDDDKNANENEDVDDDDAKNEELCRKLRYEREQILKEKLNEQLEQNKVENLQLTNKKLTIIKSKNYTVSDKNLDHSFLISQMDKRTLGGRSSFLTRDQQTISKLKSLIKANNEDIDEDEFSCIRPKNNRKTLFS